MIKKNTINFGVSIYARNVLPFLSFALSFRSPCAATRRALLVHSQPTGRASARTASLDSTATKWVRKYVNYVPLEAT